MAYCREESDTGEVSEVLGLYGPVAIPELLLQKIWLRRDFRQNDLRTEEGQRLKVIHPGRWNRQEGPDFLGAEIELEDRRVLGDVEIHFHARDWRAHRHDENPRFGGTILHVVLFGSRDGSEAEARTTGGRALPTLVLSPLLTEGLEEYAIRDALHALEQTDPLELAAPLLELPLIARRGRLREAARLRWEQKLHFASKRLDLVGDWREACHQVALEVLGYRRNRAPMAELAVRFSLETWQRSAKDQGWLAARYADFKDQWRLQGSRPANHPKRRLEQYARLVHACPDWPDRLRTVLAESNLAGEWAETTQAYRRRTRLASLRKRIVEEVWHAEIGTPRADTVLIDGILPIAAAEGVVDGLEVAWAHWWPGDLPASLRAFLRTAQMVNKAWPFANGMQQAALQIMIER